MKGLCEPGSPVSLSERGFRPRTAVPAEHRWSSKHEMRYRSAVSESERLRGAWALFRQAPGLATHIPCLGYTSHLGPGSLGKTMRCTVLRFT